MAGYHCWHTTAYNLERVASKHMCCKCGVTSVQQKGRRLIANGCEKAPAPNLPENVVNEMLALQHGREQEAPAK